MKVKEIAFTIYGMKDLPKSRAFYEEVVKLVPSNVWESDDKKMGMIEYDLGGHTFAIGCGVPEFTPGPQGGVVAFEVEDFEEAVAELKAANVPVIIEPKETTVCFMGTYEDPEGNRFVIHHRKANAA